MFYDVAENMMTTNFLVLFLDVLPPFLFLSFFQVDYKCFFTNNSFAKRYASALKYCHSSHGAVRPCFLCHSFACAARQAIKESHLCEAQIKIILIRRPLDLTPFGGVTLMMRQRYIKKL